MSIKVSSFVWENSDQKGTSLLVMLAVADICNDDGVAWPGVRRIAEKARTSTRNVQALVRRLEAAGELEVSYGTGRYHTNLYAVKKYRVALLEKGEEITPLDAWAAGKGEIQRRKGEAQRQERVKRASPNTSLEPSVKSKRTTVVVANAPTTVGGADEPPPPTTETTKPVSAKNFGVARLCQFRSEAKSTGKEPAPLDELFKRRFGDIYAAHLSDGYEVAELDPALRYMVRVACGEGTGWLRDKKRWIPLVDALEHVRSSAENEVDEQRSSKRIRSFEVPEDENTQRLREEQRRLLADARREAFGPTWEEN